MYMDKRKLIPIALIVLMIAAPETQGQMVRRIGAGLKFNYYMLDNDYFDLSDGFGVSLSFRYELGWDIYFENSIGGLKTEGGGVDVNGLTYNLGLTAIIPVLIPYRPYASFGIGVQSVNPITVNPIDTFRPTQTTFYFTAAAGVTRSIMENLLVDLGAGVWFTPYKYRVYTFDRNKVTTEDKQFTHFIFSLGLSYNF